MDKETNKNLWRQTWQRKMASAKEINPSLEETKWKQDMRLVGPVILMKFIICCRIMPRKTLNHPAKWTLENFIAQEKKQLCEK